MNEDDFNTYVDQYSDKLYRYVLKLTDDKDVAKDLISDVYKQFWTAIHRKEQKLVIYDLERDQTLLPLEEKNIPAYLFGLAYTLSLKEMKRKDRIVPLDEEKEYEGYETSTWEYKDVKVFLDRALATLHADLRSAVLLKDYEGWSYKEISLIMKTSEVNVRKMVFQAKEQLRKKLKKVEIYI